jgi:hypothetical protein
MNFPRVRLGSGYAAATLAFAVLAAAPAQAQTGWLGGAVVAPDREGDAAYTGTQVSVPGRIGGDLIIMAGEASIEGEVGDDARVMAQKYVQTGSVGGELAIGAKSADIDGAVGDDLYITADDVRLRSYARIGQDARIFGKDVLIKGRIERNLDVSADTVAISAEVGGDVTIHARQIILGPNTTIEGRLTWRSPNDADIPQDVIVNGGTDGQIDKSWEPEGVLSWASPFHGAHTAAIFAEAAVRLMVALSAFAIGILLVLLTPHYADRVFATVRDRWAASLFWGALILIGTPILALVMFLTVVGIPLGFMLFLSLPFLALSGYAIGAAGLGTFAFRRSLTLQRVLALAVGLVVVTLLSLTPFVGLLIAFVVIFLGLGALINAMRPGRVI